MDQAGGDWARYYVTTKQTATRAKVTASSSDEYLPPPPLPPPSRINSSSLPYPSIDRHCTYSLYLSPRRIRSFVPVSNPSLKPISPRHLYSTLDTHLVDINTSLYARRCRFRLWSFASFHAILRSTR